MIRFNQLEGNDVFVENNSGTRRSEKFNRFSQALRKVPFLLEERMPRGIYIRTKPSHNKGKHIWKNKPHPKGMLGKTPWNKGKKCGYIYILKPNHPSINNQGYIPEHRFIVETYCQKKEYIISMEWCLTTELKTYNYLLIRPNIAAFIIKI